MAAERDYHRDRSSSRDYSRSRSASPNAQRSSKSLRPLPSKRDSGSKNPFVNLNQV